MNKQLHRSVGQHMFFHHPLAPGSAFYTKEGAWVWDRMEQWFNELHFQHDYELVKSPALYKQAIYEQSGHLNSFADNMYLFDELALKPMNCPGHILIYKQFPRSHADLPLRLCEMGMVHRKEQSGNLNGLFRCCGFSIDDAHIFLAMEHVEQEIQQVLALAQHVYDKLGLEFSAELSLRPAKMIGSADEWDQAESHLRQALEQSHISFEEKSGEGAFYGPKIDLHCSDSLGRQWQMGSVQLDFQMPQRFKLEYNGADNRRHQPVIIHRALFGSLERMMGIMMENNGGSLPFWLHPNPIALLPVREEQQAYALAIKRQLRDRLIPAQVITDGPLGKRIYASKQHYAHQAIVGNRELSEHQVQIKDGPLLSVDELVEHIDNAYRQRLYRMLEVPSI